MNEVHKTSISSDEIPESEHKNKSGETIKKKEKKIVKLLLNSQPFKSSLPAKEKLIEINRNPYKIIDSIKEEPLEKSPYESQPVLKESGSYHSLNDTTKLKKNLHLYLPLSNSFNLSDSNEEVEDEGKYLQSYPEKKDEILLKNPLKSKEFPEVISRTPSPPIDKKSSSNSIPITMDDDNILQLLPLEENSNCKESPNLIDDKNSSTDSEYDNYHKFFDNPFLIQEKKSNEEEKKSSGGSNTGILNESLEYNGSKRSSLNKRSKTDHDILYEKISKQQSFIQKIELDIQKNVDSNYMNTIKNIDSLINVERLDHRPIKMPPSFMTACCNNCSESSQSHTPINYLNLSINQPFYSPSPTSHFDRFFLNENDNVLMTNSSSFPGWLFSLYIYYNWCNYCYFIRK